MRAEPVPRPQYGARGVPLGPLAVVLLLCALPHYLRMIMPTAALRDGFYAHGAWMLARGFEPYVDFTQVGFPLLEGYLALWIRAFGPTLLAVEAATTFVALGTAAALFVAGCRLRGPWAGGLAAVLWSWSTWTLYFDLVERETYAALGVALALAVYAGAERLDARRAALVAGALLLAVVMKITAVTAAAALCLHLVLRGRLRDGVRLGLLFTAGVLAVTAVGWLVWGEAFLWQVYVFGFFRAHTTSAVEALTFVAAHTDASMLLGWVALLVFGLPRLRERAGAPVVIVAGALAYQVGVSPTIWDHNMIDLVAPLALLAGCAIDGLLGAIAARERLPLVRLLVAGGLTAAALVAVTRDPSLTRVPEYGGGFAGRRRADVERRAAVLAAHSAPDEVVATLEPWEAFLADRVKLVRYYDLQPVAMGVEASLAADGLAATLAKRRDAVVIGPGRPEADPRIAALADPYIARLAANGLVYLRPLWRAALEGREVAVVLEELPLGLVTRAELEAAGYERFADGDVVAWRPVAGARAIVRPIYAR